MTRWLGRGAACSSRWCGQQEEEGPGGCRRWDRDVIIAVALLLVSSIAAAGPVIVRTQPPTRGAQIQVDGTARGTTAADGSAILTNLPVGRRVIRLVLPDGRRLEEPCTVTASELASQVVFEIPAAAPRAAPAVRVTVLVSGNVGSATVTVDGQPMGVTGASDGSKLLEVDEGRHTIRLSADGYEAEEKLVELKRGPVGRVSF